MNKVLTRLSLVMVLMLLVSMLAACGGGGGDDDDNGDDDEATVTATSSSGQDDATPTTSGQASTPAPVPPTATTAASPTAEPTATTGASGEPISVDALWFASDGQSVQGGTSQVVVSVASKEGQDLRVGFFESEVGGSGPQWRAAGWMSVITASLLIGNDPSNYEFSFDVAGRIDGPSAGALMTIAVLAGYLGDTVDPTVTMTGTINPDGTIGPVGGIPHKIEGAAAAGKTTVLVPGGQRYDYDYALGQSVDLVQVGQQHGVEVKLVSDIYDAYRELTGSELPAPVSTGQASFPTTAFDKYRAGATNWIAVYQAEVSDFYALPADVQEYRLETIQTADFYAGKAGQYLGEGQIAAAYENAFSAAALARVGREAAELDNIYYQQGLGPLVERLNSSSSAQTRMSAVSQRLEA
ncbi:MAG TPA: S16 family serine protease, partial [Thermomicrobiales bacterium]|nr:S16 family serine protease [Thermomicrobiales bacterium]